LPILLAIPAKRIELSSSNISLQIFSSLCIIQ
jgi:hypothetical protein